MKILTDKLHTVSFFGKINKIENENNRRNLVKLFSQLEKEEAQNVERVIVNLSDDAITVLAKDVLDKDFWKAFVKSASFSINAEVKSDTILKLKDKVKKRLDESIKLFDKDKTKIKDKIEEKISKIKNSKL